jgi:RNA recognition motif-containing protein
VETRVFVGNLAFEVGEEELKLAFRECGTVVSIQIPTPRPDDFLRPNQVNRGIAFIEFADAEGAVNAVKVMNGVEIEGRALRVAPANPRRDDRNRERSGHARPGGRRWES